MVDEVANGPDGPEGIIVDSVVESTNELINDSINSTTESLINSSVDNKNDAVVVDSLESPTSKEMVADADKILTTGGWISIKNVNKDTILKLGSVLMECVETPKEDQGFTIINGLKFVKKE